MAEEKLVGGLLLLAVKELALEGTLDGSATIFQLGREGEERGGKGQGKGRRGEGQ